MNDNGSFILNHVTDNSSEMVTRQAFGLEYYHNQNTPDKSHYFGVDVHMPDNQSIDISSAKNIVLQVGNGNDNSTYPMPMQILRYYFQIMVVIMFENH